MQGMQPLRWNKVQGSITSPQLFNIFINALLRMLTKTGQIHEVWHGLQIGKDLEESSKDEEYGHLFNNIASIDDIFNFCKHSMGSAEMIGVHGVVLHEINVRKTFLLLIGEDRKQGSLRHTSTKAVDQWQTP